MKKILAVVGIVGIVAVVVFFIVKFVSLELENSKALGDLKRAERAQFKHFSTKQSFAIDLKTLFKTPCEVLSSEPWKAYPTVELDIVSVNSDDALLVMEAFSIKGNRLYRLKFWTLQDIEYTVTNIEFDKEGYLIETSEEVTMVQKKI